MKVTGEFLYKEYVGPRPKTFTFQILPEQEAYHIKKGRVEHALDRLVGYMKELERDDPLISCELILYPAFGITERIELRIYYFVNGQSKTYIKQVFEIEYLETDTYGDYAIGKTKVLYHLLKEYVQCEPNPKILEITKL